MNEDADAHAPIWLRLDQLGPGARFARSEVVPHYPIDVSPASTSAKHYITGTDALNLRDETVGITAGWHQQQCFWSPRPDDRIETAHAPWRVPSKTLGDRGVRDARASLRDLDHPGGKAKRPVWAAVHTRAIVDLAFDRCTWCAKEQRKGWWPIAPWTVADWIWTEAQMETLKALAREATPEVPVVHRGAWLRWADALRPFADETDFAQ